jgi:sulfate adenylyltransferase (ADP) / ATP adenylyltransferase
MTISTPLNLWQKASDRTTAALQTGALESIPTHYELVEQDGITFLVRIVDNIRRKVEAKRDDAKKGPDFNPFLPYEEELYVSDLAPHHVCILNKFNVVDHHLLVITRHFEAQDTLLTIADFTALSQVLSEIDGLAFYNGGWLAGASQKHKHLQVIPLPMVGSIGDRPELRLPIGPVLAAALDRVPLDATTTAPALPFQHAITAVGAAPLSDPTAIAQPYFQAYQRLLQACDLPIGDGHTALPLTAAYNLLATRQWMFLIPRQQGVAAQNIGVNALGFAGALLVKDEAQLAQLKAIGPMQILTQVAFS